MANGIDFGTAIGLIKGLGSPDPAVIESAVNGWLDDHPEATTTVQDGSITKAKLDSNLQGTVDDVADLKSQTDAMRTATASDAGKALKAKTVTDGKVIEWEFGEAGGSDEKILIHDNLLEYSNLTAGKKLEWTDGSVIDGDSNYYCTATAFPIAYHDLPLYIVDKDMSLKAKVYQFFTYNPNGGRETRGQNVDVPCIVNADYAQYVYTARLTLDRTTFGGADENGNWAFVFTAQQYAKHVVAGSVYLYEDAAAKRITTDTNIERPVKSAIANTSALLDSGVMRYKSRNLLDKTVAQNGYTLDARGYLLAATDAYYVTDTMLLKPNTSYAFTYGTWLINKAYWLDADGNPISQIDLDATHYVHTSPSNAYGARCLTQVYGSTHPWGAAAIAINEGDSLLDYQEYFDGRMIRDEYLPGFKHWNNYKYYSIGDSRTAGAGCTDRSKAYPKIIQKMTGIVNVNAAVDGAAFCQRTGITTLTMYEQAANVPTDTDIVTIFGGTNDRIVGVIDASLNPVCERGTMDYYASDSEKYDVTTFRGAIRQTIKNIKLRCPMANIIFIVDDLVQSPDGDPQTNAKFTYSGSLAWKKAVDGGASEADMIREVAETYAIPVIDASKVAQTGRAGDAYLTANYKPFTDSLHESDTGNEYLARAVAGEMAKYLW